MVKLFIGLNTNFYTFEQQFVLIHPSELLASHS